MVAGRGDGEAEPDEEEQDGEDCPGHAVTAGKLATSAASLAVNRSTSVWFFRRLLIWNMLSRFHQALTSMEFSPWYWASGSAKKISMAETDGWLDGLGLCEERGGLVVGIAGEPEHVIRVLPAGIL